MMLKTPVMPAARLRANLSEAAFRAAVRDYSLLRNRRAPNSPPPPQTRRAPHQPTVLLNPVRFARLSFLCPKRVWSDRSCGRTRTFSGRRAWGSSHQHLASARSVADWRQCVFDPSTPCDSLRLSCSFLPALKARWHCVRPFTLWSWQPSYAVSPAEYFRLSGTPPCR